MKADIWAWIETHASLELLNPGRRIADALGAQLTAIVLGYHAEQAAQMAAAHGADLVMLADDQALVAYNSETYAAAMRHLISKYKPGTVLFGATCNGRDLAPRLACRLGTGLTADCTGMDADPATGVIRWTRPAFSGNLMAVIECRTRPQMATIRPGIFQTPDFQPEHTAPIIRERIYHLPAPRAKLIEHLPRRHRASALENAEIVIAGGRGLGKAEHFSILREAAETLGASVAASRAAVDAGWISHAHQVGQTGKAVRPKLYIACGISGAAQHVAGLAGAGTVVAINTNPEAPIFSYADYGVVGDFREVLPALAGEILRRKKA